MTSKEASTFAPFDAAEYLDGDEAIEEFVAAAVETGDPAFIARSLDVIAQARSMMRLTKDSDTN